MNRLNNLAKGLEKTRKETNLNTRRVQANFPLVERKLDVLTGTQGYSMSFPITISADHSAVLTLRFKPDNCCDCLPGAEAPIRDCLGYYENGRIGPSYLYEYDKPYAAQYTEYTSNGMYYGLVQTGSDFNYGWGLWGMFTYPMYSAFPTIGQYEIASNGRIKIPSDGVYTIEFKCTVNGYLDTDSSITQMIRVDHLSNDVPILSTDGSPFIETLSKRIYSNANGTLQTGGGAPGSLDPSILMLYATCVNLNKGDTVAGWLQIHNVREFHAAGGWLGDGSNFGDDNNTTTLNLLGRGFGTLIGYVKDQDTGEPIVGATVSYTLGFGGSTVTDEFGGYSFDDIAPAIYSVTATLGGYIPITQDVTVIFNQVVQIDFLLKHM